MVVVSRCLSAAELYQCTVHSVHECGYPDSLATLHYPGYYLHTHMYMFQSGHKQ